MKKILITGACGFIGFHLSKKLCETGYRVIGVDNLKNLNKKLQRDRLKILMKLKLFEFKKIDLTDNLNKKLNDKFYAIIHLAAKPGVRESQKNSEIYFKNNIVGFYNIIELAKKNSTLFLYASSSSVYGDNQLKNTGSKENKTKITSLSFYALTKEINENFANYYSSNGLKCFGMRFFSVYGEYGRPDMAYYKFPLNALKNKKLFLNNKGNDLRDFTHVSDVVDGIKRLIVKAPKIKRSNIFNFGTNRPTKVKKILEILKKETKLNLKIENKKKNKLDPDITNANIKNAKKIFGYKATIYFDQGYKNFLKWFLEYHK
jgi:UDP-glucuronate 4-epimerase